VAQRSLSVLAHNLATRIGSFSGYLARYRKYERRLPELKDINTKFKHALDNATAGIKRANKQLKPIVLKRVKLDLAEHLEKVLHAAPLPREGWSFECDSKPVYAFVDMRELETALL
jgi:cell shape-determining protein MreC